jgi:hypothetical protein
MWGRVDAKSWFFSAGDPQFVHGPLLRQLNSCGSVGASGALGGEQKTMNRLQRAVAYLRPLFDGEHRWKYCARMLMRLIIEELVKEGVVEPQDRLLDALNQAHQSPDDRRAVAELVSLASTALRALRQPIPDDAEDGVWPLFDCTEDLKGDPFWPSLRSGVRDWFKGRVPGFTALSYEERDPRPVRLLVSDQGAADAWMSYLALESARMRSDGILTLLPMDVVRIEVHGTPRLCEYSCRCERGTADGAGVEGGEPRVASTSPQVPTEGHSSADAAAVFAALRANEAHLRSENAQLHQGIRQAQLDSTTSWDQNRAEHLDLLGHVGAARIGVDELKTAQVSIAKRVAAAEAVTSNIRTELVGLAAEIGDLKTDVLRAEVAVERLEKAMGLTKGALAAGHLMANLEAFLVSHSGQNEVNRFDYLHPEGAAAALNELGTQLSPQQVGGVLQLARISGYHARPSRGPVPDWETGLKHLLEIRGRIREETIREVFRLALGPTDSDDVSPWAARSRS